MLVTNSLFYDLIFILLKQDDDHLTPDFMKVTSNLSIANGKVSSVF